MFHIMMQILHISEVDVRETKMMGSTPIIIVGVRVLSSYILFFNLYKQSFVHVCYSKTTHWKLRDYLFSHPFVVSVSNTADLLCAGSRRFYNRRRKGKDCLRDLLQLYGCIYEL